jgi:trk system potassium uptake protein TrkA
MARKDHSKEFAVIGLGRFGSSLARTLVARGATVLGIDRSLELTQQLADEITQTVALDSTDEDALREIDIMSFGTVVVAIGSNFEANLLTTVALRELGVKTIVCKALNDRQKNILLKVGASRVVLPESDAGNRLAQELTLPTMLGQMEFGSSYVVGELKAPQSVVGVRLVQSRLSELGVSVLAVIRGTGLILSPSPDFKFEKDDLLVVVGTPRAIEVSAEL